MQRKLLHSKIMNIVFREILVLRGNSGTRYLTQIYHCIVRFPVFNLHYIKQIEKKEKKIVTKTMNVNKIVQH